MDLLPTSLFPDLSPVLCTEKNFLYSLDKRLTKTELIKYYVDEIKDAQNNYKRIVAQAESVLKNNLNACIIVDKALGDDGKNSISKYEAEVERSQKEGCLRLTCPMISCEARTYKLKRHLASQHNLTEENVQIGLRIANKIENNKINNPVHINELVEIKKTSVKRNSATDMVNRKNNYKICILCGKLYLNMSQHVFKTHKINRNDEKYKHYVCDAEVVPRCYIKSENGVISKLENDELETAKQMYSTVVSDQTTTLNDLKTLRNQISETEKSIKEACSKDKFKEMEEKIIKLKEEYNRKRFHTDIDKYSTLSKWYDSFKTYLIYREHGDPKRCAKKALDCILPYQLRNEEDITLTHLLNPKIMREILYEFRKGSTTNETSKIHYIRCLQMLLNHLIFDINSPENEKEKNAEEMANTKMKLKQSLFEIETVIQTLSKQKGKNIINKKNKVQIKLMEKEEMDELQLELESFFDEAHNDVENKTIADYTDTQIINVRNHLLALGAVRLGRRSKELLKMKKIEVANAEKRKIKGIDHFIIKVADQKNSKTGDPAPVAYKYKEYIVLNEYLKVMKSRNANTFNDYAFCKMDYNQLSYSSLYNVLQKFKTRSGKTLSTRIIRQSRITNHRAENPSDTDRRHMSRTMNHGLSTAESHYNYTNIIDAVVHTLANNSPNKMNSTTNNGKKLNLSLPNVSPITRKRMLSEGMRVFFKVVFLVNIYNIYI